MFRNTFLALAATAGLIGGTEFSGTQANAATVIRVGVGAGVYRRVYRPIVRPFYVPPPVIVPAPVVVYRPAPVYVTPVVYQYDVLYRGSPYEAWRVYGTFGSDFQAQDRMNYLRSQGFEVSETQR